MGLSRNFSIYLSPNAAETPANANSPIFFYSDVVFLIIFTLEIMIKVAASGLCFAKNAYLCDPLNSPLLCSARRSMRRSRAQPAPKATSAGGRLGTGWTC